MQKSKCVLLSLFFVLSLAVLAQDKVAYLNMGKIFEEYYKTVNANIVFEQKKQEYEDKMGILRSGLEEAARELKKLEDDSRNELLAQSAREEAVSKYRVRIGLFNDKREEFERSRQRGAQELRRLQAETEDSLVKELRAIVDKFASDNGYTHVYDVSGMTMNRMPYLLVYPKQQEATDKLLKVVNAGHETELKDSKAKLDALRGVKNTEQPKAEAEKKAPEKIK